MQVYLSVPCCSLAMTDEVHLYGHAVEVDEETAARWQSVMAQYDQV